MFDQLTDHPSLFKSKNSYQFGSPFIQNE